MPIENEAIYLSKSDKLTMFITAGFFTMLLKHFENISVDVDRLFSKYHTNPHVLDNPVAKIDANILGEYLEIVTAKSGNNRIGLEIGFILPFTITGAIFNIYHNSKNVSEIFENIETFDPIVNDISHYTARVEGDLFYYEIAVCEEFTSRYPVGARQWREMEYGISLQYAHSFTGRYLHPILAHSVYPKEGKVDKLEEYLGCPVKFGQDKFALIFNKSVLELPVITANRAILPIFTDYMNEIRRREFHHNKLTNTIRRYLLHSLSTADLNLKCVAARFNMSERNIQRRLRSEETSYQQILNNLRIELSQQYLREGISFNEITFLLGFESQSAFNKFFRKHFRTTPNDYRKTISD